MRTILGTMLGAAALLALAVGSGPLVASTPLLPAEETAPPPGTMPTAAGGVEERGVWRLSRGETLREVLERWGKRAGTEVVFLTDRGWTLHASWGTEGTFAKAVARLMKALSYLPHSPAAAFAQSGRTLVVQHQVPLEGEER